MQCANKAPSGCAAGLLLVVVGMGIMRAESRMDMVLCPLDNPQLFTLGKEMLLRLGPLPFWVDPLY